MEEYLRQNIQTSGMSAENPPDVSTNPAVEANAMKANAPIGEAEDASDDVVEVKQEFGSTIVSRAPAKPIDIYTIAPPINSLMKSLAMDYSRFLNKPILTHTINWSTTSPLVLANLSFPSEFLNNSTLRVPFLNSAFFRAKACIIAQVSGTPMHQGTCILTCGPPNMPFQDNFAAPFYNSLLTPPHSFLTANDSASVCVPMPFYSNTSVLPADVNSQSMCWINNRNDSGNVRITILNPLVAPTSGSTAVSITIHVKFEQLEFYVPHIRPSFVAPSALPQSMSALGTQMFPEANMLKSAVTKALDSGASYAKKTSGDFIDAIRGTIREYTGLHNPNISVQNQSVRSARRAHANITDSVTVLEKLDPFSEFNRVLQDPVFHTAVDEMAIQHLISTPHYIGTFNVQASNGAGRLLWSRPISPIQSFHYQGLQDSTDCLYSHPMQRLAYLSKFWRGTMKIHIQANMSNFHFAKLAVVKDYSTEIAMLTQVPNFNDIQNLMVDAVEFSGGGQVATITLPYNSSFQVLPTSYQWETNALQHGMYYIYLMQPLVTNGSVSSTVSFNVYLSACDDFEYYGYPSALYQSYNISSAPPVGLVSTQIGKEGTIESKQEKEIVKEDQMQPKEVYTLVGEQKTKNEQVEKVKKALQVELDVAGEMNPESCQSSGAGKVPTISNSQKSLQPNECKVDAGVVSIMRPLTSIRDIGRRFTQVYAETMSETTRLGMRRELRISELLGFTTSSTQIPITGVIPELKRMFLGYTGGWKFKILVIGASDAKVYFKPPTMYYAGNNVFRTSTALSADAAFATAQIAPRIAHDTSAINFPLPTQESANHTVSQANSYDYRNNGGNPANFKIGSTCILDLEVPDLNCSNFVGSMRNCYFNSGGVSTNYVDSFGSLILTVSSATIPYALDNALIGQVSYYVYAAMADEGRFGFNVSSAPSIIPRVTAASNTVTLCTDNAPIASVLAAPRYAVAAIAPAAYFTAT